MTIMRDTEFIVKRISVTFLQTMHNGTIIAYRSIVFAKQCETYILDQQRFQIEVLKNLDQLPATGALIVCGFPRVRGGSGFTARCYVVVEK